MSDEEPTEPRRAAKFLDLRHPHDDVPVQADDGRSGGPHPTRQLPALPAAPADRESGEFPTSGPADESTARARDQDDRPRTRPGPLTSPDSPWSPDDRLGPSGPPPSGPPPSGPPPSGPPPSGPPSGAFRIALWGAPSSGKTLFLQMLPTAARQTGWVDRPRGPASVSFFKDADNAVINNKPLSAGTEVSTRIQLQLARRSRALGPGWLRPLLLRIPRVRRRIEEREIVVQTVDRPGGDYADRLEEVVEELMRTDAIIFLYDPTRDMPGGDPVEGNSFEFFKACLDTLRDRSNVVEADLPQSFAVCITKFDSLPVFDLARQGRWTTQDDTPPYSPRVADDHARDFFHWLCSSQDLHPSVPRLHEEIVAKFPPARTRFFVTSASGFRLVDGGRKKVDLTFPENVQDAPADGAGGVSRRLHSPPHPVNVMEPILALYDMAREGRR